MGANFEQQANAIAFGQADVVELPASQVRPRGQRGVRTVSSDPVNYSHSSLIWRGLPFRCALPRGNLSGHRSELPCETCLAEATVFGLAVLMRMLSRIAPATDCAGKLPAQDNLRCDSVLDLDGPLRLPLEVRILNGRPRQIKLECEIIPPDRWIPCARPRCSHEAYLRGGQLHTSAWPKAMRWPAARSSRPW